MNNETIGSVNQTASVSTQGLMNVGTYAISASQASGGTFNPANYAIQYSPGVLTIKPALLNITATNVFATAGVYNLISPSGYTATGLQNNQTIQSLSISSLGSAPTSTPGRYSINVSNAFISNVGSNASINNPNLNLINNYSVTYIGAFLTLAPSLTALISTPILPSQISITNTFSSNLNSANKYSLGKSDQALYSNSDFLHFDSYWSYSVGSESNQGVLYEPFNLLNTNRGSVNWIQTLNNSTLDGQYISLSSEQCTSLKEHSASLTNQLKLDIAQSICPRESVH
jgi:hypothetical protein